MSDEFELLVIGGGPAGFSATGSYRGAGGRGAVAIVTDEARMPYRRPPLTKELLRGEAGEDELPLAEESWLVEQRVSLISGRAVSIDPEARTAVLSGGRRLKYSTCVLATGAEPQRLPVPGADDPAVRVIRSPNDVQALLRRVGERDPVIVIGSGFIGCEAAASLRARGNPVTLVSDEPAPNAARLGPEPAHEIQRWLELDGVELALGTAVERIERGEQELEVSAGSQRLPGVVVVMATGVAPRGELAQASGLEVADGAVRVDSSMRTTGAGVLAAGDACKADNAAAGRALRVEHWGDALGQGEVAGRTAAGRDAVWSTVPGFWSTIGRRTLKYAAWGDGFDQVRLERHQDGGFTAWYGHGGVLVGVLTHEADKDYERGKALIAEGAAWN